MSEKNNGSQLMTATPSLDYRGVGAPPPRPRHVWVWVIVVMLVLIGAGVCWRLYRSHAQSSASATAANGGNRATPVVVAKAVRGTMPIYLNGLGTVTPLATVAVRSRVDGQVTTIYYKEGEAVHEGDPLVEIDPRPYQAQLQQVQGQLTKDQAALQNALADLKRFQTLFAQNYGVTQQQVETQQTTVNQDQGTVQVDQAQVDNAKLNLVYCHITSPVNGRIGLRQVDIGNLVHATDTSPLLIVNQLQPITVVFTLPQQTIGRVMARFGSGSPPVVEAWDSTMSILVARGKLLAVDNQVDPSTGTYKLKAEFSNEDNSLFPNEFVNSRLLIDTMQGVVIVPTAAVQRGPDSTYVYAVKTDQTVELRTVRTGPMEADRTVIVQGLQPGDVVVTDGVDKLQAGATVQPHEQQATTRPSGQSATTRPAHASSTTGPAHESRPGSHADNAAGEPRSGQ